jgi:hypothetical protein
LLLFYYHGEPRGKIIRVESVLWVDANIVEKLVLIFPTEFEQTKASPPSSESVGLIDFSHSPIMEPSITADPWSFYPRSASSEQTLTGHVLRCEPSASPAL